MQGVGRFGRLSLATRYALVSGVVLLIATLAIGFWVTSRIEDTVVRNSANATAIYMESFLSPISDQLAGQDGLSPGAKRALDEIFTNTPLGERVVSYKIWRADGLVIEASNKDIIGRTFPITDSLRQAWDGHVVAQFDRFGDDEDVAERAMGLPLVEIYSPIHEVWSGDIVAVAEFYEVNAELKSDLAAARWSAWGTVSGIVLGLGSVLYAIVLGGSRTIEAQRRDLDARLADLADMSDRNTELRLRVQGAAARAAEQTDRTMRRIGADLHDGAAQYLAYAALRLDNLRDKMGEGPATKELEAVTDAVSHAMTEVRALSRGLSLPEMTDRPLVAVVQSAAEAHEVRTSHAVAVQTDCPVEPVLTKAARICAFRFVQEGLNNASRHADGVGLAVRLTCHDRLMTLTVRDGGPGLTDMQADTIGGLGLSGLRDRVESLGGTFTARTHPDGGADITMTLETGIPP